MRAWLLVWSMVVVACGDDGGTADGSGTTGTPGTSSGTTLPGTVSTSPSGSTAEATTDAETSSSTGAPLPELDWGPCPLGFETECAYVPVPIVRDDPGSLMIEVMISRRPAPSGAADAQVWLMQGGPGGSADAFVLTGTHDELGSALPNADVYTIEHRGVGESGRLHCPDAEAPASPGAELIVAEEIPACAAFLDDAAGGGLSGFSSSEAARDLQYALSLARQEGQRQFVYGLSYGTYWAMRFLQLFPDEVDGVILDSVASPVQKFNEYDTQADPVVLRMADVCAADPVCSMNMGADSWATTMDAVAALEAGQCGGTGLVGPIVPVIFWQLIADRDLRETVFPLLYRLTRCDPEDVAAVEFFLAYLPTHIEIPEGWPTRFSLLLQANVSMVEFWRRPYDAAELFTTCEEESFCPGLSASLLPYADAWPTYEEPLVDMWIDTDTPILAFNGDFDPQTAIETATELENHLSGAHQNFYEVPDAPHWILLATPVQTEGSPTCGVQMIADFVTDPSAPPDATCLSDLVAFDPAGDAAKAMQFFGTPDMWDNPAAAQQPHAVPTRRTPRDWSRATQNLRRMLGR